MSTDNEYDLSYRVLFAPIRPLCKFVEALVISLGSPSISVFSYDFFRILTEDRTGYLNISIT